MISIPFKFHTPDAMLTEAEGMVRIEAGRLVLEFETKDAFLGAYRSGVQEVELYPDDVTAVLYRPGWFKTELTIRVKSMKQVDNVPGSKHGEVRLRFKRRYRSDVAQLASFLQHRLSELKSQPLDDVADDTTAEY